MLKKKNVQLFEPVEYKVDLIKNIFKGKSFVVFATDVAEKTKIEKKIVQFGGVIFQNPTSKTDFILANNRNYIRVKNWIEASKSGDNPYGDKDIFTFEFVDECLDKNEIVKPHSRFLFYVSENTKQFLNSNLDSYLNSNTELDTKKSLLYSINVVKMKHLFFDLDNKDKKLINDKFELERVNFLRGFTFYTRNELTRLQIKLYGGEFTKREDADYVIVKRPESGKEKSEEWLQNCIKLKKII